MEQPLGEGERTMALPHFSALITLFAGVAPGLVDGTTAATELKAAVKIIWNQFLTYWSGGSTFNVALVSMLQPKSIDREIHADGYFMFWDGQAEKYRRPNPLNLQSQFLGVATFPTDLE